MEPRKLKLWLTIILAVAVIQLLVNFFLVSPRLRRSLDKLEQAERSLDSARQDVRSSKTEIDSIRTNLAKFNNYVVAIQHTTELLSKERELRDAKFKSERDSILADIKALNITLDTLTLPPLKIYDTRQ
jgi:hypothetical protein